MGCRYYRIIQELCIRHNDIALVLVDIPIGLPSNGRRACDLEARRLLGRPRASSVFPVPCREAVYENSYAEACRLNKQKLGIQISKQTWNIVKKIAEIDSYLVMKRENEVCSRVTPGDMLLGLGRKAHYAIFQAVSAKLCRDKLLSLPQVHEVDELGLSMEIVYCGYDNMV
jgi:hypothetical protein